MLKTGMIIAERYEIVSKIGTGGMADVYKAMDHKPSPPFRGLHLLLLHDDVVIAM